MSASSMATARPAWPDEAPFDAILAAASGCHVPDALKRQLAIGGTLVMPIGEPGAVQALVKVRAPATEGAQRRISARSASCR